MNKTVYLRDEEVQVWERARELAEDKLSPIIVSALRQFIAAKDAAQKRFERIEVPYRDAKSNGLPRRKAFYGRWIFPLETPAKAIGEIQDYYCALAVTAKGAVVTVTWQNSNEGQTDQTFSVYSSLEEAAGNPDSDWAARNAHEKIGVPVEELDI